MKLFITGISGLLGLNFALQAREHFTVSGAFHSHPVSMPGCATAPLDLMSLEAVEDVLGSLRPDVVVHTAALTDVERCEENPTLAHQLNREAARHIAMTTAALGAKLVHISTDQLFDGTGSWATESDRTSPLNVYAETKLLAEQEVLEACPDALIIRTNFFGWGTQFRKSFSDWILENLEQGQPLTMFSDAYFTPLLINHLVDTILALIKHRSTGIFHVGGKERLDKYDFALKLAEEFEYPTDQITPVSIDGFSFKAKRPKDMSLRSLKLQKQLKVSLPTVNESLRRLRELRETGWRQSLIDASTPPTETATSSSRSQSTF